MVKSAMQQYLAAASTYFSVMRRIVEDSRYGIDITLCGSLCVLIYFSSTYPALNLLTVAILHRSFRVLSRRHGYVIASVLIAAGSLLGQLMLSRDGDLDSDNAVPPIVSVAGRVVVVLVHVFTIYLHHSYDRNFVSKTAGPKQTISVLASFSSFGLLWAAGYFLVIHVWGLRSSILSTNAVLYPIWLSSNGANLFLDAILSYGLSEALEIWLEDQSLPTDFDDLKDDIAHEDCSLECKCESSSKLNMVYIVALAIGALWIFVLLTRHSPASSVRIGCTNPVGLITNNTVIEKVREEMAYVDVLVLPATANYITDVNDFTRFKATLEKVIDGQLVSVVFPTQDFREEQTCDGRYNLQVYNLGEDEETTMNSYTHTVIKANSAVSHERLILQSLFRTWVSLRVQDKYGRLIMASAICLESDFPNVFRGTQGPDLLIIPASSWSMSSPKAKMKAMTELAIKKSTNILYCDSHESAYIDSRGKAVRQFGQDSFSINYDLLDKGILGYRLGLWWILAPVCVVCTRMVRGLRTSREPSGITDTKRKKDPFDIKLGHS